MMHRPFHFFHPDFDRWPRIRTDVSPKTLLPQHIRGRGLATRMPLTASEEFHLALKQMTAPIVGDLARRGNMPFAARGEFRVS